MVNKTTIYELGQALKQCSRVISVDTGTLHFACALDLPVTAVFYKQDFVAEWAPSEKLYNVKLIKENQTAEKIVQTIY